MLVAWSAMRSRIGVILKIEITSRNSRRNRTAKRQNFNAQTVNFEFQTVNHAVAFKHLIGNFAVALNKRVHCALQCKFGFAAHQKKPIAQNIKFTF